MARNEGIKIEDRLIEHGKKVQAKLDEKLKEEQKSKIIKTSNATSMKYIIQKFRREFRSCYRRVLELPEEATEDEGPKKINYIRLKDLLVSMGLLSEFSATSDSQERILMYDMWRTLRGEVLQEVSVDDVGIYLLVILKMTDHKRIGMVPGEGDSVKEIDGEAEIGFFNAEGKICFRQEDVSKSQKHYNLFYVNRL